MVDPLVAVTVIVLVPVGDFGPELLEQAGISRTLTAIMPSMSNPSSPRLRPLDRRNREPPRLNTIPITPVSSKQRGQCEFDPRCDASIVPSPGITSRALVFVLMVKVPVAAPEETVTFPPLQDVFAGRPLQVIVTVPVKPLAGVTVTVVEPELPRRIISEVGFRLME